eukprot:9499296-Pyramimonas_sp.AAC.1
MFGYIVFGGQRKRADELRVASAASSRRIDNTDIHTDANVTRTRRRNGVPTAVLYLARCRVAGGGGAEGRDGAGGRGAPGGPAGAPAGGGPAGRAAGGGGLPDQPAQRGPPRGSAARDRHGRGGRRGRQRRGGCPRAGARPYSAAGSAGAV